MSFVSFSSQVNPDWEALVNCICRKGTPKRVHFIELMIDAEVQDAVCSRFGLDDGLDQRDPYFREKRAIRLQRFLGYDYVRQSLEEIAMPLNRNLAADTAGLQRSTGRSFVAEGKGLITTWEEFEKYPWPDPEKASTRALEWYEKNLPDDMCVIGSGGFGHFAEYLSWLMGYETLCYALFENRDLVKEIAQRLLAMYRVWVRRLLEFERVKIIWASDDMGYKTGPLISPADLREFVFPGHCAMAAAAHDAGRPYVLHSCGNLETIMDELIADVKIDAKHSFEDTIESVSDAKKKYGDRIAVLGGIDVDFLCRATEQDIRGRVRHTLDACVRGGGYCLGTGNSVANYIPLNNYLVMLDEGRTYRIS
jgi:uroporphyrinogen decarboxylase